MKRYADIAHYRAPYKDVMLSGFGADETPETPATPAATTAATTAAPAPYAKLSPKLAVAYRILYAYSEADKDGVAVLTPQGLDFVLKYAAGLKGVLFTGSMYQGGALVSTDSEDYSAGKIEAPSMLDFAAALTGRGATPKGVTTKITPNESGYLVMFYAENASGKVMPNFFVASKEAALKFQHKDYPTYFVVLKPGQKLSASAESLFKYPAGMSMASMLGYGALGLAAAAGLFMLLGGKKKSGYESNPKRKKKARKAKRAKKAAHKPRRVRRARKTHRVR